jgi:hypothetical protein
MWVARPCRRLRASKGRPDMTLQPTRVYPWFFAKPPKSHWSKQTRYMQLTLAREELSLPWAEDGKKNPHQLGSLGCHLSLRTRHPTGPISCRMPAPGIIEKYLAGSLLPSTNLPRLFLAPTHTLQVVAAARNGLLSPLPVALHLNQRTLPGTMLSLPLRFTFPDGDDLVRMTGW